MSLSSASPLELLVLDDWDRVRADLGLIPKQLKAAIRTATRQAGQWANREGSRGMAKATNIPLKVIRAGLRIKFEMKAKQGKSSANLWYGINPIALKYLSPKQQKKGVKARGNTIKSAFIVAKSGGGVFLRAGTARTPLVEQKNEISEKAMEFLEGFRDKVMKKFEELFFAAVDKLLGRESGSSASMSGGLGL